MKSCHWITQKNERIFIPGCMGGAAYGPDKCTCDRRKIKNDRMDELERRVKKLEEKNEELAKIINGEKTK
jgi:hypothetical protein